MKLKFDQADEMSPLTKKVMGAYNFCGDKLLLLAAQIGKIPGRLPEILFLLMYILLYLLTAAVHEPGMDVLASWNTVKNATLSQLLFRIPHEQFCPPLWNLLLLPFAKTGTAVLALTGIGLVLSAFTVALILFKAPFTRIIRLVLPFTYFLFYQYGIAADAWRLVMLAFVLLSVTYQPRNEKPAGYIMSLLLLSLSSAYGLVVSLGIGIVFALELCKNRKNSPDTNKKALISLTAFFAVSLIIVLQIFPHGTIDMGSGKDIAVRLLYLPFSSVADAFLTNTFYRNTALNADAVRYSFLAVSTIIGAAFLALIGYCGRKKKTAGVFFVPFLFLTVFSVLVGIGREQTGIVFLLALFWFWISAQEKTDILDEIKCRERDKKALKSTAVLVTALIFAIHLNWTLSACLHDKDKEYWVGRNEAEFLKENKLDSCTIVSPESCVYTLTPYLGEADIKSDSDTKENKKELKQLGQPDVLYMNPDITKIWDEEEMAGWDYTLVYLSAVEPIWKTESDYWISSIYIRSDLAKERNLEEIANTIPEKK